MIFTKVLRVIGILLMVIGCIVMFLVYFSETDVMPKVILENRWIIYTIGSIIVLYVEFRRYNQNKKSKKY